LKDLDTLANSKFDIPGDSGFPLNAVYQKPANQKETGNYITNISIKILLSNFVYLKTEDMRAYIKQIRLETGLRVCAKVYEEHGDKPSKVRIFYAFFLQ
jgi:actin related protein 2/3 complex subunit 3